MNDAVVAIVSIFFIFGIVVGIIAVVAMSVLRAERRGRPDVPEDLRDYEPGEADDTWGDDTGPDDHSRWPGDAHTDFRGR